MFSPLSYAPADTPAFVIDVSLVLALCVFPGLFVLVCLLMLFARVARPPYFAYLCAFGSLGTTGLGIASANSPLSVLSFLIAFLITPLLMVRNLFVLRSPGHHTIYHLAARWASLFSLAVIVFLLVWSMFDGYVPSHPQ